VEVIVLPDIQEFILKLDKKTKANVYRTIGLLGKYGNNLPMAPSKSLGGGLFELRTRGKKEIRLLYGIDIEGAIVVYGFIKKTLRTPKSAFDMAMKRLRSR